MTETDKNTLPQELREWTNNKAEDHASQYVPKEEKWNDRETFYRHRGSFIDGAAALYAHLKPLIDEKGLIISMLEINLQEAREEIERLKK